MEARLTIGKITRPQGIKGELKVSPLTDDNSRFLDLKRVYIAGSYYQVKKARLDEEDVYIYLEGITDRNAAETLRNKDVQVDREDAVKLEEGRYFIVDILKSKIYLDDEEFGTLKEVLQYGSADVYVIKTIDNKEAMVPALKTLIKSVDIVNKVIVLDKKVFGELVVYED